MYFAFGYAEGNNDFMPRSNKNYSIAIADLLTMNDQRLYVDGVRYNQLCACYPPLFGNTQPILGQMGNGLILAFFKLSYLTAEKEYDQENH